MLRAVKSAFAYLYFYFYFGFTGVEESCAALEY